MNVKTHMPEIVVGDQPKRERTVKELEEILAYVVQLEIGDESVSLLRHIQSLNPARYAEIRPLVINHLSPKALMEAEPDTLLVKAASYGKFHQLGAALLLKWYKATEASRGGVVVRKP